MRSCPTTYENNSENYSGVAVPYVIEALRIFDHYHFRVTQQEAKKAKKELVLAKPPRAPGKKPWWAEDYTNARKIRDRELFA